MMVRARSDIRVNGVLVDTVRLDQDIWSHQDRMRLTASDLHTQ